jgi:hypothetical protein
LKRLLLFIVLIAFLSAAGCVVPQINNPSSGGGLIFSPVPNTSGFSKYAPAPMNTTVTFHEAVNDSGQGMADYSGRLTLLEVLRGAAAMDKMKHDNPYYLVSIQPGREFLAARFKYELIDTNPPGYLRLVNRDSFSIYRSGQFDTEDNKLIMGPTPDLYGKARKGGTVDGWIVFTVPEDAPGPLIVYGRQTAGNGGIWFKAS